MNRESRLRIDPLEKNVKRMGTFLLYILWFVGIKQEAIFTGDTLAHSPPTWCPPEVLEYSYPHS